MQAHNPKIVTDGLICHLDPTNGGKGGSKILAKPTQVDGCVLWLDAADAESVVGSTVTDWLDKSGNGNHLGTVGGDPAYGGNYKINDKQVIYFDGNDSIRKDSTVMSGATAATCFVVYQPTIDATSTSWCVLGTINNDNYWYYTGNNDGYWGVFTNTRISSLPDDTHNYNSQNHTVICTSVAGSTYSIYWNGEADATVSGYDYSSNAFNVGDRFIVGAGYNTSTSIGRYFKGYIAEVIAYSRELSDTERQSVEYYLSRKWAIPLKGRVTTNLADGVNTTISDSGPAEITHLNTLYFPNPADDNCDLRLEGNEITIADNLPWTMEFWMKRDARGGVRTVYGGVWGNEYGTDEKERLQFTTSATEDKLILVDDGNNNSSTAITNSVDIDCLHKWRHVVLAFDGTTDATTAGCVRQYVDGSDKGPTIALVNADSKITIKRIGSRGSTTDDNRLEGELGNFRVYNKQLSHAEVLQNYNAQRAKYENKKMSFAAPDNLVLYLDAQSGTSSNYYANGTWYDISGGTAYNATRANATFTDEGVKYYDFDGTDDSFVTGSSLPAMTNFTISFWFAWGAFGTADVDFVCGGGTSTQLEVHTGGGAGTNGIRLILNTHSASTHDISSAIPDADWHYYSAVYVDNSQTLLYRDGALISTDSHSVSSATASQVFNIGHRTGGSYDLTGKIASMMIHNISLSADQVMQNYNYFKHRFGK